MLDLCALVLGARRIADPLVAFEAVVVRRVIVGMIIVMGIFLRMVVVRRDRSVVTGALVARDDHRSRCHCRVAVRRHALGALARTTAATTTAAATTAA